MDFSNLLCITANNLTLHDTIFSGKGKNLFPRAEKQVPEVNRSCNMEFGSMDIQRETRLSIPVVTDTDLVIILPQIVEGELYMERMGIGDHLYGAKSRILRFVDGRNDCQCLFVGLAAKIPAAKVAVLGKSFG